jgi:hypothetical protein
MCEVIKCLGPRVIVADYVCALRFSKLVLSLTATELKCFVEVFRFFGFVMLYTFVYCKVFVNFYYYSTCVKTYYSVCERVCERICKFALLYLRCAVSLPYYVLVKQNKYSNEISVVCKTTLEEKGHGILSIATIA